MGIIATKISVFFLFLAILYVVKELLIFFLVFRAALRGDNEQKYTLTTKRGIILWASLAYILTIIFTGLTLF